MEITVKKIKENDSNYDYDAYTVHVEDHRILTIATYCAMTATKWLKDLLKSHHRSKQDSSLLVGLSAERRHLQYSKSGLLRSPYDLLQLSISSHCLLFHLPYPDDSPTPKPLLDFFSDPRVLVVAVDVDNVSKTLFEHHGIKIKNAVDLNGLAVKALRRHDLDLEKYDLDRLAKVVLGKHVDVVRPEKKVKWFHERSWHWYSGEFTLQKVKYATVDPYLCFLIGYELMDIIDGFEKKKKEEKKKSKSKKERNL